MLEHMVFKGARGRSARGIAEAIEALPRAQRDVIELHAVRGCSAPDTAEAIGITEVNQRVLLHRARAFVRGKLEEYYTQEATP